MKAGEQSFRFITKTSKFEIPFFQRGYVWDKDNWEPMLEDFLDNREGQFFGSIILKHKVKGSNDVGSTALVIDGQQRLTTMSILLKAVNDSLDMASVLPVAYRYLFYKPDELEDKSFPRIKHSKVDRAAFEFVLKSSAADIMASDSQSKIISCYKYFREKLGEHSVDDRKWLFNRLVNSEDPFLVVIDLDEKDNEQSIFDTINSAGVRLSYADTIKNLVFQVALDKAGQGREEEVYRLYEESWFKLFEGDEVSRNYWQQEAQSIRVKRTMLEVFLHSFAIIHAFYDPRKDSLGQLPDLFRKKVTDMNSFGELKVFLEMMAKEAEIYREHLGNFAEETDFRFSDYKGRLFHILDQCNVLTFHPYLLLLFTKYQGKDEATLRECFADLERFIMRQYIAHTTTRQNNTYCVEFISDESAVRRRADEIPQSEIDMRLRSIGNRQAKLVLFWLELYRRHIDTKEVEKSKRYCYQLEHILPQKWEENWSAVPVLGDDGMEITDKEKARAQRNRKCHEIGNMTLLGGGLNVMISNSEFVVKIEGERGKKGVRQYAELHITKDDILAPYYAGDKVWDEAHITARTEKLIGEFNVLWGEREPIQKTEIDGGEGVKERGSVEGDASLYLTAAEQGDPEAQCNLGLCYIGGKGVEKSAAEAAKWYRKAAEQGSARGQNDLGVCYENGEGVEKDAVEAVKLYRKAAEQGYAVAQNNLGLCYENGEGVEKDAVEAAKWYRKAAEQGDPEAQCNLGVCYENGEGVVMSIAEAVRWYRKAAEQGGDYAQNNLGVCYENGRGVAKDAVEAVKWYRRAAEQGCDVAQCNLGLCYENGRGVEQSLAEAEKWYRKAAENGLHRAKIRLKRLLEKKEG